MTDVSTPTATLQTWIILGASSAMARAFARRKAAEGAGIVLCGRDTQDLARDAGDLDLRGAATAQVCPWDSRDPATTAALVARATDLATDSILNVAVFAGSMPPQEAVEGDPDLLAGMVTDNFSAAAQVLLHLAPLMSAAGAGYVVGVASVAGDRGRLGNYAYGAAKAGFATFLSGHRNRMGREGVHVLTVKPGFVDTAMTWGLEGMFLVAAPDKVAADIEKALRKGHNVLYTPIFWLGIMTIIRMIPERIFKKMSV